MIETERLLMRQYVLEDIPKVIEQRTDAEIARYIGGAKLQTPEFIESRIKFSIENYKTYGFGMCAMIWKETGENIGWSGLQPLEDSGEIEVGYGVTKDFWRRGIGFECAAAWLKFGFETANLKRIVACANEENTGSWRIMEKCGMKYEGLKHHYGMDLVFYAISKAEFLQKNV